MDVGCDSVVIGAVEGGAAMTHLIEMLNIRKTFGAIKALDGVDLAVDPGEVIGLVGDNAAGKSTLMKVLSGAYQADSGTVHVNGDRSEIHSVDDARALGIEMVYQDLALADNLDVTANIYMGREMVSSIWRWLECSRMEVEAQRLLERLKIDISNVRQLVATLSGGQRQAVAIARAMAFNARLVILDEPTASLSPETAEHVLDLVRTLKKHGVAVILINHRTDEVTRVADRLVVMRHGRIIKDVLHA
jgi:ABC-type sugar transport system ATPase subunit